MSDLPRLLLCSFDVIPGPSGSSRRLTEYLKALPDRFSVVVLSAKTPDHSHIEKYQGARLLRVPVGSGDLASRIQAFERAVRRQLESEDYALAHFTDPFGGYALCELKGDYGYRLIYEAQSFPSQELRYTHPQTEGDRRFLSKVRRQELFCLMNADLVVTGSATTRAYIQSLGASEEQIRVLPAPVDLAPYTPEVLGVPDGEPLRMMYLGSQVGWQGLSTLLRAMALAAREEEVRLTVVGARHPDWQPHLDDLVKELGLGDRVEFQPPVHHDDLAKVLALADVGVLPLDDVERNRVQGGPLAKVSEYLAAGRPVITSDLPVTRELVPEGAAVFFPPGNSLALADCIIELARDVPRRLALGRAARAHAEEALDAGLIRGKLLDLYDSLLEKRSEPISTTSEDDLPMPTTVTGTPTNRLAALLPPEPSPTAAPVARPRGPESKKDATPKPPARDDLPLVKGQVLVEEGIDTRLIKTELESNPIEPPVVMGAPLRESPSATGTVDAAGHEAAAPASEGLEAAETAVPATPKQDVDADAEAALPIVQATELEPEEATPSPTPVVRMPPPPNRSGPASSIDAGDGSRPSMPAVRVPPPPGRGVPTSRPEAADASSTTPIVKAPEPPSRSASDTTADDAVSATPIVKAPAQLSRSESAPADDAASATPIVKAPASLNRSASASSDADDVASATPIIKAPALLQQETASASDAEDAVDPSVELERAPPNEGPLEPDASSEAPAPTPVVRSPVQGERYEPPAHTPVVRSPFESEREEPPAPTPIIRVPTELLRELVPTRSSSGQSPSDSNRPEEYPTPTPIVPAPSPLASRSTSARVETPVGRIASLPHQPRTSMASDPERPPPILRPSAGASESDRLPPIRGGGTSSSSERTPPTLRPSTATPDAERPPALPPRASTPPPVPRQRPPRLQSVDGPPRLTPVDPSALEASAAISSGHDEEPEEISEDEAESIDDGEGTPPARTRPQLDEPDEISSDEVEEAEISATGAAQLIDADDAIEEAEAEAAPEPEGPAPEPVPSTLNPWFAQLAHGYCPPDGIRFDRHTPPTTFPGRDEATPPSPPSPSGRPEIVVRGKGS